MLFVFVYHVCLLWCCLLCCCWLLFTMLLFTVLFVVVYSVVCCCLLGVDDLLAQHIAHLFIRDPVSLFQEKINQTTDQDTDHFEVSFTAVSC